MSLYGENEVLQASDVSGVNEGLGDGNATVILGKTYQKQWQKNGVAKSAVIVDMFIYNFTPRNGAPSSSMLQLKLDDKRVPVSLQFPKAADGNLIIYYQPKKLYFMEAGEGSTPQAINMFKIKRRDFAKKFPGALIEDKVNWGVIQKAAGTFISVDFQKDGKYVQVVTDHMAIYDQPPVPHSLLLELYRTLDIEIERQKAAKQASTASAPPTSAPPPTDADLPF